MTPDDVTVAAWRASLMQLVSVVLLAARRGDREQVERVAGVLLGHGTDGLYALLYGAADAALGRRPGSLPEPVGIDTVRRWLPDVHLDPVHRWCVCFLLARARVDITQCTALVSHPPKRGLLPVLCQLAEYAAVTTNATQGTPS